MTVSLVSPLRIPGPSSRGSPPSTRIRRWALSSIMTADRPVRSAHEFQAATCASLRCHTLAHSLLYLGFADLTSQPIRHHRLDSQFPSIGALYDESIAAVERACLTRHLEITHLL